MVDDGPNGRALPGIRRPVTGKLQLEIIEAKDLAHAPTRMFRVRQTAVMVKIDGNTQCRTRSSKTDKWTAADSFEMHVDKATELELLVYDQSGERTLPIGLLWLKISDITESLRRQKVDQDQQDTNWVSADVAQQHPGPSSSISPAPQDISETSTPTNSNSNNSNSSTSPVGNGGNQQSSMASSEGIRAWFDVEPVGQIHLQVNFGKGEIMSFFGAYPHISVYL